MTNLNDPSSPTGRPPVEGTPPSYPPPPPYGWQPQPPPAKKSGVMQRVAVSLITSIVILSLLMNLYMMLILARMGGSNVSEEVYKKGDTLNRIVIVPVTGMIDDGAASFVRDAMHAVRDLKPKALILRVDSGGGTVGASDRIYHEMSMFKKETGIPVVASFGSIAASGGYYISAGCDTIFAEPTCVTGSIGVMAQAFTVDQLLAKIGVTPEVMAATQSPDKTTANDFMRPWDDKDRTVLRNMLDRMYDRFVVVIKEGRAGKMTDEEVKAAATGRIFTTDDAISAKLVDSSGYLDDAIADAVTRAGLSAGVKPHVTILRPHVGILDKMLGTSASSRAGSFSVDTDTVRRWMAEMSVPRLEYSMSPVR